MKATLTPCEAYTLEVNGIKVTGLIVTSTWECFKKLENATGDMVITLEMPAGALSTVVTQVFQGILPMPKAATIVVGSTGLVERISAAMPVEPSIAQLKKTLEALRDGTKPGHIMWGEDDFEAAEFALMAAIDRHQSKERP